MVLQTNELKAISEIQESKEFKACINDFSENCGQIKVKVDNRTQTYNKKTQEIWVTYLKSDDQLQSRYLEAPANNNGFLIKSNLNYFKTAYAASLEEARQNEKLLTKTLKDLCDALDALSCLNITLDMYATQYSALLLMNQDAVESLETGKGNYVPESLSI